MGRLYCYYILLLILLVGMYVCSTFIFIFTMYLSVLCIVLLYFSIYGTAMITFPLVNTNNNNNNNNNRKALYSPHSASWSGPLPGSWSYPSMQVQVVQVRSLVPGADVLWPSWSRPETAGSSWRPGGRGSGAGPGVWRPSVYSWTGTQCPPPENP